MNYKFQKAYIRTENKLEQEFISLNNLQGINEMMLSMLQIQN